MLNSVKNVSCFKNRHNFMNLISFILYNAYQWNISLIKYIHKSIDFVNSKAVEICTARINLFSTLVDNI